MIFSYGQIYEKAYFFLVAGNHNRWNGRRVISQKPNVSGFFTFPECSSNVECRGGPNSLNMP